MDCTVCKNAMITLELTEVEIDYCTGCGGIWLVTGELELLLEERRRAEQLLNSFKIDSNSAERRRKCPICPKKMQKIIIGQSAPTLLIDKCPKNDGLWLDQGELQDILERAELDKDSKIQKLLADMFGTETAAD